MRNEFTENMKQDMYEYFIESYPQKPPKFETIYEVVQSEAAYEKFTSSIGLGELLEKPEDEDLVADKPMESYTIVCKNRTFGRTVKFSKESVEDSQKVRPLVQKKVATWAPEVYRTKEKFYARMYNNGSLSAGHAVFNNSITDVVTDATGNLAYDNKAWFSTTHADKVGNSYSNYNSSYSLTAANLKNVYNQYVISNAKDERGQVMEHAPDALILPPALKFTAQEILNSTLVPDVTNNTVNVLKSILPIVEWAYLTDADGWFMSKLLMGKMATDRQGVILDFWKDELSLGYHASINCRFGGAPTNWRFDIANNTSSS